MTKVLIVDQFAINPSYLQQHAVNFDELCAQLQTAPHGGIVQNVEDDFKPRWGTTVLRADWRGRAEVWRYNWDSSG